MRVLSLAVAVAASTTAFVHGDYVTLDTVVSNATVNSNFDVLASNTSSDSSSHRHLGLSCSIQNGIDFQGNDIGSVLAGSANDCCAKCSAQSGCGAFTWNNYNGGTCWLKSGKGNAVANSGAQSAEVSSSTGARSAGSSCSIESGVGYKGNDIGSVQAGAASDCCAKCSAQSGCGAFTWTNYNGGTCWLKSGKGETESNDGAQSAQVSSSTGARSGASSCSIESGVGYKGNDIGSAQAGAATDCCNKCTAFAGCAAFTWTGYNGGTCWFKSGKGETESNPNAFSSVVDRTSGMCLAPEQDTDYSGDNLRTVAGATPADCCFACAGRAGCNAYTWTNYNGGTCWLKTSKGTGKSSPGAVSGVVDPSRPAHIQPRLRAGEIPLRSANLGGWLVGEYWMSFTSPAWQDTNGVGWDGEYLTMKKLGKEKGTRQFEQHRATWITENDIAQIAAAGMNAVRVPVGFWIINDDPWIAATDITNVFAPGALKYLNKLVNVWAVKYNIAVMLSLHAHQGSQNGYDHSSPQVKGQTSWSDSQDNYDSSVHFAIYLASLYKDNVGFLGMNLMNEPAYPTDYDVLFDYYEEVYKLIRDSGNNCILVVSPTIGEQAPPVMMDYMLYPEYTNVWQEFHVYYKWGWENKNERQIINAAGGYRATHLDNWTGNWIHMGEWSLAHPDEAPFNDRNLLKEFAAVQMKQYEGAHAGWSFWSWRHDEETQRLSGWSLRQLLREGILTVPRVN